MGEIHELFVLALHLVWFARATPDPRNMQTISNGMVSGSAAALQNSRVNQPSVRLLWPTSSLPQKKKKEYTQESHIDP